MKIVALREHDLEDLNQLLLPKLSEGDKKVLVGLIDHLATVRQDWASRVRYFLQECGWQIP